MPQECSGFESLADLRDYIHEKMCELEQLDASCFPLTQQALKRGGQLCGFLFSILGPRSVVFNAIYETQDHRIHFYNSSGERVVSQQVLNAPSLS